MQLTTQTVQPAFLVKLILDFFLLWYWDAILAIAKTTYGLVVIVSDMFALPVLFKTLFLPYRAENRKGFVAVAIGIGFVLRMLAIVTCLALLMAILVAGSLALVGWVALPLVFLFLLFKPLIL